MSKDEALELALDALESCDQVYGSEGSYQYFSQSMVDKAITAIKQARSAPVQEPIGEVRNGEAYFYNGMYTNKTDVPDGTKLYTTPPAHSDLGLG